MRRKRRYNEELLKEEISKFKMMSEYSFYVPENDDEDDETENLILGEDPEEDETGVGDEMEADAEISPDEEPVDAEPEGGEEDIESLEDMGEPDDGADFDAEPEGEDSLEDMGEPNEDEVEIDVTELVKGTEEAKETTNMVNQRMEDLMGQFDDLENKLSNITNTMTDKVEDLENEVEKRMPTPEEKIEMRSLDSYPYNLKLTDYWSDKEGQYDVMDGEEGEPDEYVLTKDDIDSEYNEGDVKDSFSEDYEDDEI